MSGVSRRGFFKQATAVGVGLTANSWLDRSLHAMTLAPDPARVIVDSSRTRKSPSRYRPATAYGHMGV